MNETGSNFSRSAGARFVAGKPREETNAIALSSSPGLGEDGCQHRLRGRKIECLADDRGRRGAGGRVGDLEDDGGSAGVRAERAGSGRDGHEDKVRLTRWAAQVQRAGDAGAATLLEVVFDFSFSL